MVTHTYDGSASSVSVQPRSMRVSVGTVLAEVGRERVEEPPLGGRQLDALTGDGGGPLVEVEREVGPEHEALAGHAVAQAPEDPLDPGAELGVVVGLGDVVLGHLREEVRLAVAGVDGREDDDRQVRPRLDLAGEGEAVHAAASSGR